MGFKLFSQLPNDCGFAIDIETNQIARWDGTRFVVIADASHVPLPDRPTADGKYYVTATVDDGAVVYGWQELQMFSVTYKAGDGDGDDYDGGTRYVGDEYTVLDNYETEFTREGYTFDGWTVNVAEVNADVGETAAQPYSNVIYTAKWAAIPTYSVTYSAGDGVGEDYDGGSRYAGVEYTVLGNDTTLFTMEGFDFDGWTASGAEVSAEVGATVEQPEADVTYTAVWVEEAGE